MSIGGLWVKNFFFKLINYFQFKTVLAWMSKLHSVCPLEYFEEKVLFWSSFFRLSILDKGELFSALCQKKLGRGFQNCSLHIDRKILRKILFSSMEKPFFSFFFGKNRLKRSTCLGNYCFSFFQIMTESFSANCQKSWNGAVKTALCISRKKIWRKRRCSKNL